MAKKLLFLLPCVLLIACTAKTTPLVTPSSDQMDAEEASIYAEVLAKLSPASGYVIMDGSATGPEGVQDTSSTLEYVLANLHSVSTETVDSFRLRNDKSYPIRADMLIGTGYVLLSQEGKTKLFNQNQDGWQLFYEQYPDAPGITSLSRVGFNQGLNQALVYIGTQSQWLAGSGYYILLNKVNAVWVIDQEVMTWIS